MNKGVGFLMTWLIFQYYSHSLNMNLAIVSVPYTNGCVCSQHFVLSGGVLSSILTDNTDLCCFISAPRCQVKLS